MLGEDLRVEVVGEAMVQVTLVEVQPLVLGIQYVVFAVL